VTLTILQILATVIGPIILLLSQKTKLVALLSPVVCSYMLGILIANIPGVTLNAEVSKMATEASVPLAIPLLLFGTDFLRWFRLAKSTVLSFSLIVFSVCLMSFVVSIGFKNVLPNFWQIGGMLVGVYTGGTPNMTAIGLGLGVKEEIFILMNGADLILGAGYLLFILTIGTRLIGHFLPAFVFQNKVDDEHVMITWDNLTRIHRCFNSFVLLILSGVILGISLLLSHLIYQKDEVAFIILVITTLGIAASFLPKIRSIPGSYEVGQYLLLVFCVGIGSQANIAELINGSWIYVLFFALVMFSSIILHLLLCKLFKIDRDTAIITSMAGIFGPPFVGPVASVLKNREIVVSGLTSGLVGYAIGNYLGMLMAYLLKQF
jgi:uncharacterized membrane protein